MVFRISAMFIIILLSQVCIQQSSDVSAVVEAGGEIQDILNASSDTLGNPECSSCVPFTYVGDYLFEDDVTLRHRKYLIDSGEDYFPERVNQNVDPHFPQIFEVDHAEAKIAFETVEGAGTWLRDLLDRTLHKYGAVVIRGMPLNRSNSEPRGKEPTQQVTNKNVFSFSEVLRHTGYQLTKYIGGVTVRPEKEPMIYPASDENPEVCMDLHQDNTYWPRPPAKLFFFYENVAARGGLNPLLDMRKLIQLIPAEVADKFEQLGVRYENFYPDKSVDANFVPWQASFQTQDRQHVEDNLKAGGFQFEWEEVEVHQPDSESKSNVVYNLRKWNVLSPFKNHPVTGEKLWVNMIVANHASYFHAHPNYPSLLGSPFGKKTDGEIAGKSLTGDVQHNLTSGTDDGSDRRNYPFNIKYGDGSEVPYSVIQILRQLAWENARGFQPRDGDVLVVDNYIVQHGRLGYTPPRNMWIGISLS